MNILKTEKLYSSIEKFIYEWGVCNKNHIKLKFGQEGEKFLNRLAREYKIVNENNILKPPYYAPNIVETERTIIWLDTWLYGLKDKITTTYPVEFPYVAIIRTTKNKVLPVTVILEGEEELITQLINNSEYESVIVIYKNETVKQNCSQKIKKNTIEILYKKKE